MIRTQQLKKLHTIKTFGNSMMPLLLNKDIVYLKKKPFSSLEVNDIICIKKSGKVFTHRVIYRKQKFLVAKGDNNSYADGKIYPRNVLGTVYKIKRNNQTFSVGDLYLIQSTFYFEQILEVKRALEKAKINFVFLKGLPIYLHYEGSYPKRLYADCDILIDKAKIKSIGDLFKNLGYRKEIPRSLTGKRFEARPEITFYKLIRGFPIIFDIHFEIVFLTTRVGKVNMLYPDSYVDKITKQFLTEKESININNESFPILARENFLVYLFLHLFKHNFKGMYRYDFIVKLLAKKINFEKMFGIIDKYRLSNFVYPCFLILAKYYGLDKSIKEFDIRVKMDKVTYINNYLENLNVFQDDEALGMGSHFRLLFNLSPNNFFQKVLVFINPQILNSVFWVLKKRVKTLKVIG